MRELTSAVTLIRGGADLNTQNRQGSIALMEAAFYGQVECLKMLIQEGADLDIQSKWHYSFNGSSSRGTCGMCEDIHPRRS